MEDNAEDYGTTYLYFNRKMQRMREQMQQERENQRRMAAIIAGYMAGSDERTKYPCCEAALADFQEKIKPDDDFRDEAIQIFQLVWDQNAP